MVNHGIIEWWCSAEELLHFYLKKKISFEKFDMDVIREVDLNKIEPWDLQGELLFYSIS